MVVHLSSHFLSWFTSFTFGPLVRWEGLPHFKIYMQLYMHVGCGVQKYILQNLNVHLLMPAELFSDKKSLWSTLKFIHGR